MRIAGERAVISLPIAIESYPTVEGVECVLSTYARHLYRLREDAGKWKIVRLDAIYERSEMFTAIPGDSDTASIRQSLWVSAPPTAVPPGIWRTRRLRGLPGSAGGRSSRPGRSDVQRRLRLG